MPQLLDVSLRLALFFGAALLLLAWTGYGPAALLLPARLRPYGALLAAPLGFCWLALLSSLLNSTFLPMALATPLMLALAGAVNVAAWRAGRRFFPLGWDTAAVAGLAVVPFVIAGLPLVNAGSTAFAGNQWDLEVYLPITEYLKRYAIGAQLDALPNPITTLLNAPDFRGGSGWGFSYVEAAVGTVLGWPSYLTFRPLLHLLMTLSVPCVYVMARALLGMDRRSGLLLAALWSVHGLSIWLASIGLAGHAASFFLLPLALTLSFLALEEPEPRAVLLAGSAVAGLVLCFYTGALPFYALPTAAYGLWLLARRPDRRRTLAGGLGLVAAALLLAPVAHLRFLSTLAVYFGKGLSQGWSVAVFSPAAEALGLSPFILIQQVTELGVILGEPDRQAYLQAGWLLTLAAGGVALAGLWRGPLDRTRFLALLLPALAFAAVLRFGMAYHYGYFKAVSLLAVFLLAPIAAGAVALWDLPRPGALRRWTANGVRLAVAAGGLAFVGAMLFTTSLSVRYFWKVSPDELPRSVWQVQGLKDRLPKGAPVWVFSRSGFNPRAAGMIAYFLMDNPLDGALETAYGRLTPQQPGRPVEYLAVLDGVQPPELGLDPDAALWRNELVALYRAPDSWRAAAHLEGGASLPRLSADGGAELRLDRQGWALEAASAGRNASRQRPPDGQGNPSLASAGADLHGAWWRPADQVQPQLTLMTSSGGDFHYILPDSTRTLALEPGLHNIKLPSVQLPAAAGRLSFAPRRPDGAASILALRFSDERRTAAASEPISGIMALDVQASATEALDLTIGFASPDPRGGTVTAALELYRNDPNGGLQPAGYWELARAGTLRDGFSRFHLDLTSMACEGGREDSQAPPGLRSGPLPDGRYAAHLALYHMEDGVARWPWVTFRAQGGRITVEGETPPPEVAIVYLPEPREVRTLRSHIPEGAGVLVVPDPDPDRSFIAATAGFLEGRGVAADPPLPRPGLHPAEPGRIYDFALLPDQAEPEDYGYEPAGLVWRNRFARLYTRTAGSPAALYRFPNGLDLAPGQTLGVALAPGGSRLDLPDGSSVWGASAAGAAADVEFLTVNPAAQPLPAGPAPQGVVRERRAAQPQPDDLTLRAGDGPLTVAAVRLAAPSGRLGGRTVLEGVAVLRTQRAAAVDGAPALRFDAAGTAGAPVVAGLDVYSRGQCAVNHFGYWALALPGGAATLDFALAPAEKRGVFSGAGGAALPADAQTWPTGDGLYRAMLFLHEGDVTYMTPALQFRLSGGRLSAVESFASGRLLLLRRPPPAP